MQYAYNTVPYFMQFGSADFGPKMDPIRPKITRNVPNSFPVFYLLLMYYRIALKAHRKVVVGAEIAWKGQERQKKANLSYNTAQFVQYGKIRVKYHTAYYTNTPYNPSL
jgi:hypothetical protein